jgi:cytochrome d ubiquinol oxidase subunit II
MDTFWFFIVACMVAVYVVLDGFDFGAGILHLWIAKTDTERRTVLGAIGPVWDGNEVWLLASGGMLVFAFPKVYAAGFSGFYLPLMMVLWLLILRGLSVEFRSHQENPLWRSFWDGTFAFSSTLMAIVLGAALGNVIRGVPLNAEGYFRGPLFTNFLPGGDNQGVLDWYTVLVGVFALLALGAHGALYLIWKTEGPVQERARRCAGIMWMLVVVAGILTTIATAIVQPNLYPTLISRPWTWILAIGVVASLVLVFVNLRKNAELPAFLSSAGFILCMLAATAAGIYPNMLVSTVNPAYTLTAQNSHAGELGMRVAVVWWVIALALAAGYFTYLFHSFRGKVKLDEHGHGY